MNEQHTPGPWVHHPEDNIITAESTPHATLIEWQARSLHVSASERDANARLIAAAPEMLDALRRAVLALAFAAESSKAMQDDYEAVSLAIAKATGAA